MKYLDKLIFTIAIPLLLSGCPATRTALEGGPKPIRVTGAYVHEPSGMVFPEAVGRWKRWPILQYDVEGRDVSAGYNLLRLGSAIAATVYVYPAPVDVKVFPIPQISGPRADVVLLCFQGVKNVIRAKHPDAKLIEESKVTVTQGETSKSGHHAVYRYTQPTPYGPQMFLSEVYLLVHKKWFIKYRITYLEAYGERCSQDAREFIRGLKWPENS